MSTPRDEDALSWGGDDDPTLEVSPARPATTEPPAPAQPATLPDGYTAVGRGSESVGRATQPAPGDGLGTVEATDTTATADAATAEQASDAGGAPQTGNAALLTLGVLGGFYLLWTIGWVIGGLRLQDVSAFLVSPVAYVPAFWLAVLAPAIWFGTTVLLTRHSAAWLRIVWLVAGVVLLVPWPFVMVGAVGQ